MESKIIKAICEYKGLSEKEVNRSSNLICDLGLTSMELFEILCGFEEELDFDGIDIETFNCETVGELIDIMNGIEPLS